MTWKLSFTDKKVLEPEKYLSDDLLNLGILDMFWLITLCFFEIFMV